jgi:DNA-binding transcriptional MerR regulator
MAHKDEDRRKLYSTTELAAAVGVTPRTVRFYEAQGLLQPQRAGTMRVYTYRDRARLALIRRGKRLGFTLQDIADVLELYGADPEHAEQTRLMRDKARARIGELQEKLKDLQDTLVELRGIERAATEYLQAHANGPQGRDKGRHS